MKVSLINTIIQDVPDKSQISDGIYTFGELNRNLLSLYINFLDLLEVVYASKGVDNIYWIAKRDSSGIELSEYIHLGIFMEDSNLKLGLKVPSLLWDSYSNKSTILDTAPEYKPLYESLPNYFYDSIKPK